MNLEQYWRRDPGATRFDVADRLGAASPPRHYGNPLAAVATSRYKDSLGRA